MTENKKNILCYKREYLTGMGSSKIQLFEIENPGTKSSININGKLINFETFNVLGGKTPMNPYVFIEKYKDIDLTTIDILYGNLNINELRKNENERRVLFDDVLTRKNLDLLTRRYCGAIPSISFGTFGNKELKIIPENMSALAKAILSKALTGTRRTSIKINMSENWKFGFSDLEGNPESFWDKFFENKEERKKKTELGDNYLGTTTYTKNEGIICFKSGAVIFNESLFLKLNYATKDEETGVQTKVDSILTGDFNFERLKTDEQYWQDFIDKLLSPSALKNLRSVKMFPYIGSFTESGEIDFDPIVWDNFNRLNIYDGR